MIRRRAAAAALGVAVLALTGCTSSAAPVPTPRPTITATATPTPTPTSTPTAAPTPATLEQRAAARVAAMTPQQRAGTLLMTAGTVDQLPGLAQTVRRYSIGGVMVRGRSAAGTAAVAKALGPVRAAASADLPLLTATDQEGGLVQVLSGPGFASIPSAVEQARRSPAQLRGDASRWGRSLADAGVRLDLAPVADVPCPQTVDDNPPVADLDRDYGTDPVAAGDRVAAFVRGLRDAGVESTVKHFPGLGCVTENTDTAADVVDTLTAPDSPRIGAFRAGIDAGAGFVMVSSASYSRIDPGVQALFSPEVIRLLRSEPFDGVVISDDVGNAAALRAVPVGERATRFIAAGGDLLLDVNPAHVPALSAAVVAKAAADPAFADRVEQAATRVVAARLRLAG